jgi:hypothetical protein
MNMSQLLERVKEFLEVGHEKGVNLVTNLGTNVGMRCKEFAAAGALGLLDEHEPAAGARQGVPGGGAGTRV